MKTDWLGRSWPCVLLGACMLLAMSAGSAAAASIDFTDYNVWGGADGVGRHEVDAGGVGVTASAEPAAAGAVLRQSFAGLGVDVPAVSEQVAAEVDGRELLSLSFDQVVIVDSVYLTNFYSWGGSDVSFTAEQGAYVYEGGERSGEATFRADSPLGVQALPVDSPPITRISFVAHVDLETGTPSGFSVAGLSFRLPDMNPGGSAAVPELDPSSSASGVCLALGALLLVGGHRRRRRR